MASLEFDFNTAAQAASGSLTRPKELLRFTTAGSVDDGKSTLIGRLLYDSQSVYEDQLASVQKSKINRSGGPVDLSLLTDGLRAEREQGITIDVAYRYFSTPRRKFIIADTPGHEQYTRNMATGASTAELAIVLIDATKGVLPQSRRHAYIAHLLGIRHVVAAVNKMDLADYAHDVFESIASDFRVLAKQLGIEDLYIVPISALAGDNVVTRSERMPWFHGPTLLEQLENVDVSDCRAEGPIRLPIQRVVRPDSTFRGFAGLLTSGTLRPGDSVTALPSGVRTRIKSIVSFDGDMDHATQGTSITVTLEKEIDISRGDLLAESSHLPVVSRRFDADVVWMDAVAMDRHKLYVLKHTTRMVRARIKVLRYRVDVHTYDHLPAETLHMNDIGCVEVESTQSFSFDAYSQNRSTGSFILIDPVTNATVAAGMIRTSSASGSLSAPDHATADTPVTREERIRRFGHPPAAIWISGSPRAAELVERYLFDDGWQVSRFNVAEFSQSELRALASGLAAMGGVIVLSSLEEDGLSIAAIQSAFPANNFFQYSVRPNAERPAAREVLENLRRWRDTRMGALEYSL